MFLWYLSDLQWPEKVQVCFFFNIFQVLRNTGVIQKVCTLRDRGGATLKAYENVQGEGGRGKAYVRYKIIADSIGDFSRHILAWVNNFFDILIFCLASSTDLNLN